MSSTAKEHYLGIDLGTSGCRAILIDDQETPVAEHRAPMDGPTRDGNRSEQDPEIWWTALKCCLNGLARQQSLISVSSIAIDGTSGTLLLCDRHGTPATPALMYDDARAEDEVRLIKQLGGTGPSASATSALAKALQLSHDRPESELDLFVVHQADWIAGKLTGTFGVTDINNALKLGFDAKSNDWHPWVAESNLFWHLLPMVVPVGAELGVINRETARELGLPPTVRIMAGTTDSTASVVATRASQPGDAVTILGSTLVTKVISNTPISDEESGIYSHKFGELWLVGGASNSGGSVLSQFFSNKELAQLETQLNPKEPLGLNYYPLPRPGERFPINDASLSPRLSPRPVSDAHFLQGLLEGIADIEALAYERLEALGCPRPTRIFTIGGGARNEAWRQIRQNKLGIPVENAAHQDAAFGSAKIALRRQIPRPG